MWKIFKISFLILLAVVVIFSVVEIAKDSPESILKGIIKKGPLEGDAFKFKAKFLGVVTAGSAVISNEGKAIYPMHRWQWQGQPGTYDVWIAFEFPL